MSFVIFFSVVHFLLIESFHYLSEGKAESTNPRKEQLFPFGAWSEY